MAQIWNWLFPEQSSSSDSVYSQVMQVKQEIWQQHWHGVVVVVVVGIPVVKDCCVWVLSKLDPGEESMAHHLLKLFNAWA
jgi:hypothetical protein